MNFTKMKANGVSWCSCCGKLVELGQDLIKVEAAGMTRYVALNHLVSWASLTGEGETLALNKKMVPVAVAKAKA